ncbi:MAG: DUF427 domain-containing protein [Actinomycetota bacterium]
MTLTLGNALLGTTSPDTVNYTIDGPRHRLLMDPFPRRARAEIDGVTLFDTVDGQLVHESNIPPVLYVPVDDVDMALLEPTDHSTHCPFKGDASYWSARVGDRVVENAFWGYLSPLPEAPWLKGYVAPYFQKMDRWFDEDTEVFGHLRDPYHRVDARPTSRPVTVRLNGDTIAESTEAVIVSETGLPNRWYIPRGDVRVDLVATYTTTHCPYKGQSTYWSAAGIDDVAWSYEEPFDGLTPIAGRVSFDDGHDGLTITVGT